MKRLDPEALAAAVLAVLALGFIGSSALVGLSVFWSDLTYLHFGWRAAPAMLIEAGRAPLWEPALYFGMPMAASMQGGLFYPPAIFYYLFGFAAANALFQALHLFLAGWLCALWLRSWRLSWGASLGAAIVFAFGGVMISRLSYLNHLSVLVWAPALALFFRKPLALALVLSLMVLAGYPSFIPGCAAAAWAAALAARADRAPWRQTVLSWMGAGLLAAAVSCVQLLPGLELAAYSRRAGGVGLAEGLAWGFSPRDLLQWIGPLAVGWSRFHPADEWYKCVYLGVVGFVLAAYGLYALSWRRRAVVAVSLALTALLTLAGSNPVSDALWRGLPFLRFVRYPGNVAYIALLPLSVLIGVGLQRRRSAPLLVLLAAVELVALGRAAIPLAPHRLFVDAGALVRTLQERLDGTRYLISPRALHASIGVGVFDWKQRLYGLTNAPYRLRAAANFGEPLVPAASYSVMDELFKLPSVDAAASWLPWIGVSRLLTPTSAESPRLISEGAVMWEISKAQGPASLAYHLSLAAGAALPADWPPVPPELGAPLSVRRSREDQFEISGEGAGWAYVAEPCFPGWKTFLDTPAGRRRVFAAPALAAFQKFETPSGPWTFLWRYEPGSWRLGLLATWLALLALGASWYHRALALIP
jgi:hypothetical protein